MPETFYIYEDMIMCVDRPRKIEKRDKDIGNRCRERLLNATLVDDWTKEVDALIEKHKIKFRIATKEELEAYLKKGRDEGRGLDVTYRG